MYYSCVVIIIPILVLLSYFTETNSIAVFFIVQFGGIIFLGCSYKAGNTICFCFKQIATQFQHSRRLDFTMKCYITTIYI